MNHQTLFRLLPWPVAAVDADLVIREASEAFASRSGGPPESLIGRSLYDVLPGVPEAALGEVRAAVGDGFERQQIEAGPQLALRVVPTRGDGALVCVVPPTAAADTAERLETLSEALRTIKHEINNPLTGALGNINMLLRRDDWDEKTRKRLTTAEQEMKKIGQIVVRLADLVPPAR